MGYVLFDDILDTENGALPLGTLNAIPPFYGFQMSVPTFLSTYAYNGGAFDIKDIANNAPTGQVTTDRVTLTNGNYALITIDRTLYSESTYRDNYKIELFYQNGDTTNIRGGSSGYYDGVPFALLLLFVGYNDNNNAAGFLRCYSKTTTPQSSQTYINVFWEATGQAQKSVYEQWVSGSIYVPFNWKAWDQLKGNNGQYRCDLTKISNSALEDITVHVGNTSSIFSKLSSRSSIWSIIQNASLNTEITIMWSGENKGTVTMTSGGVEGNYNLTFKLYNGGIAFYTYTTVIVYSPSSPGVNTDSNLYLSFAYDSERHAAVFLPIIYKADGLDAGYSWGLSNTNNPGDVTKAAIYNWLIGSGSTSGYPYDSGTTDDGGNPAGPQPGDHMPRPGVPSLSGLNAKLVTLYVPSDEQLEDIAEFLWSDNVITNIRKFFNNVSDNVIALYVLPYTPANLPTKNFTVGNMTSSDIIDVSYVTARFVDIDMGSVTVNTTYDSYLDFEPYTRFKIYLPGVGLMGLSADDIMCPTDPDTGTLAPVESSTISLKYTLDLMTGLLVAFVFVNGEMRYQFPGKVGYNLPITGANYTSLVTGAVSAMAGLIGAAATGGLSAPITAGSISAAVSGTVNAMKPDTHRGGNLSGDVSMMSEESPYLIYYRPNKPLLEHQELYTGFPTYKTGTVGSFTGYATFIDAHIESISCTNAERDEIMQLLKSGVII